MIFQELLQSYVRMTKMDLGKSLVKNQLEINE